MATGSAARGRAAVIPRGERARARFTRWGDTPPGQGRRCSAPWRARSSRSCSPTSSARRRSTTATATRRPTRGAREHFARAARGRRRARRPRGQVDRRRADGHLHQRGRRRALRGGACSAPRPARPTASSVRIGIDAGEPLSEGGDLYGTPVIVASRLCDAAGAGRDPRHAGRAPDRRPARGRADAARGRVPRQGHLRVGGDRARALARGGRRRGRAAARARRRRRARSPSSSPTTSACCAPASASSSTPSPTSPSSARRATATPRSTSSPRRRPDVVLMDIRMPELDGLAAAERILADPAERHRGRDAHDLRRQRVRLQGAAHRRHRLPAQGHARPTGCSTRCASPRPARRSSRRAITRRLIADFARASRPAGDGVPPALAELTAREIEVLRLVARRACRTPRSPPSSCSARTRSRPTSARLLGKLGLRDRVQAVVLAYETGLVTPDVPV